MKIFFGFALCLLFILASCQSDTSNSKNTTEVVEETVYTKVDIMPRFAGCEDKVKEKRTACASGKMFKYISENIQYPAAAKSAGIEGRAVISFIVDKSGKIRNVEVIKDSGNGMGEEAKRVVKSFPKWIPGIHNEEKVNVKFLIPVNFKL